LHATRVEVKGLSVPVPAEVACNMEGRTSHYGVAVAGENMETVREGTAGVL
jgi:hypothetical protein